VSGGAQPNPCSLGLPTIWQAGLSLGRGKKDISMLFYMMHLSGRNKKILKMRVMSGLNYTAKYF